MAGNGFTKGRRISTEEVLRLYDKYGTIKGVATALKTSRRIVRDHLRKAGAYDKPLVGGRVTSLAAVTKSLPQPGEIRRYICTSAQNNTWVWGPAWENLLALAKHYDAEILISRFSYNKNAYGKLAVKPGTHDDDDLDMWYDPKVEPHICDERVELAPGLVFCGEMNILPTAARPLSGFETYTGRRSGIFPHVKLALESIHSGKYEATKLNYTTGTVTQLNYIQKKAGLKAEFHHCYGGLLVEVDSDGSWYCRQLNADRQGTIQDLAVRAEKGRVTKRNPVEAVTWGDVHVAMLDDDARALQWGRGGVLDKLKPRYQFMHDLVDFRARNHHDVGNPHRMFEKFVDGVDSVEGEMSAVTQFLNEESFRDYCRTVVVDSNHDNALERWLREADYRRDPLNAIFFLRCQLRKYEALSARDRDFHMVEWVLQNYLDADRSIRFLREDQSFVICRDKGGGIECGIHGHLGPGGSKGTPLGLSRMGRRANTGHTHGAQILDGMYVAGTSSQLDMGFNRGPSNWTHSFIVTYPNGKRAICTIWNGKAWA